MQFEFTKGNVDNSEDGSRADAPGHHGSVRWGEDSPARQVAGLENDVRSDNGSGVVSVGVQEGCSGSG
jgi:hypothetical protein